MRNLHMSRTVGTAALALATFGFTVGVASGQQLTNEETRYLAWRLGSNIGLAAIAYSRGAPVDDANRILRSLERPANYFGAEIPPLPSRTGDRVADASNVVSYLIDRVGGQIGGKISAGHSSTHAALFELGVKSNLIYMLYFPNDSSGEMFTEIIRTRASTAGLPPEIWMPLVRALDAKMPSENVESALRKMHRDIGSYLAPDP